MLKENSRSYGYDLLGSLPDHAFTDGEIEKAVLYRTLRRLEQNGYITSDWDTKEPGLARRVYALTPDGEKHMLEWAKVLAKVAGSMTRFVRLGRSGRSRTHARATEQGRPYSKCHDSSPDEIWSGQGYGVLCGPNPVRGPVMHSGCLRGPADQRSTPCKLSTVCSNLLRLCFACH